MEPPAASTRWLLVAAAVLAATVVLGLLVAGEVDPADLDADDPSATVRDFLLALQDRDGEALRATVAADLRENCAADQLRRATRGQRHRAMRATLVEVHELDGHAEVEVRRTEHRGEPPFGGGGSERTEVFELTHERGAWVITQVPWSYGLLCPEWSR